MSIDVKKQRLRRLLSEKARRAYGVSLAEFTKAAWHVIEPTTDLLWNYHHDAICDELEAISYDLIAEQPPEQPPQLIINEPPRYMKSIQISIMWPVWEWGPFGCPWSRWIFGCYDLGLATDHSVARRTIIESDWYQQRWGQVFQLSTDQNVKTKFANTKRGAMLATSTGAGKIGRGGDRVVLDDPHDPEKILSDDIRERDIRVFKQGYSTRLNNKKRGAIVIVMQRLHDQDLSAHGQSLGYRSLVFDNPCQEDTRIVTRAGRVIERKAGELLWPEREGPKEIAQAQRTLGPYGFAGQYLQRPTPAGGVIFQRDAWRFYKQLPAKYDAKAISVDCAFKAENDSDYVASIVGLFVGASTYIVELTKERLTFSGTRELIKTQRSRHPDASHIFVEDKANGPAIIDDLKNKITGLVAVNPEGGKIARAWSASGDVEAHNVYLPEYLDDQGVVIPGREWVAEFIDNTAKFPKVANDDDVDAFTQLIIARRKGFDAILEFMRQEAEKLAGEQQASAQADGQAAPPFTVVDAQQLAEILETATKQRTERDQHAERAEAPTGNGVDPTQPTMTVADAMTIFGR